MNDYVEVNLTLNPFPGTDATDLLAGLLGDIGYESFVEVPEGLTAYVQVGLFSQESLDAALADFPFDCHISAESKVIEGRDWNEEWERNYFQPIVVGNRCVVHSSFHTDVPKAEYDIVIDPKMAFGTGHHATTSLVLDQLLEMPLEGKCVIDMGTGTGILAILAAMRGAKPVYGIEIDEFAYENAVENVKLNGHPEVNVLLGSSDRLAETSQADVFVANINRNVITDNIADYAKALRVGGVMLLSGFYVEDIPVVEKAAVAAGLSKVSFTERDKWTCLKLTR